MAIGRFLKLAANDGTKPGTKPDARAALADALKYHRAAEAAETQAKTALDRARAMEEAAQIAARRARDAADQHRAVITEKMMEAARTGEALTAGDDKNVHAELTAAQARLEAAGEVVTQLRAEHAVALAQIGKARESIDGPMFAVLAEHAAKIADQVQRDGEAVIRGRGLLEAIYRRSDQYSAPSEHEANLEALIQFGAPSLPPDTSYPHQTKWWQQGHAAGKALINALLTDPNTPFPKV